MEMNGAVASSAILVMGLVGLFSVALPLGLALLFRRRTGGRTRFFLLGCVVFPLFAMGWSPGAPAAVLRGLSPGAEQQHLAIRSVRGADGRYL